MLLRASIRLRRVSRSRTSAIFSRRTRLQLIRSRLSILVFVSSSTRTVTRGTDDIPSILYIYLLETSAASTANRPVGPSFLPSGIPDERPDHCEWRDQQQVERPQIQRRRDQLERIRDVLRLRIRVRPLDRIVARTRHAPGVVRAVARYVEVFEISADVGVNVERDQRPRRGVRGPGPDEDVAGSDREAEGREIRMEGGVRAAFRRQHELAFVDTMLLPGPWAATEGAIAAAQTRIVRMNPTRRVQLPPAKAMWKVAKRSKPSKRAMRACTLHVPG